MHVIFLAPHFPAGQRRFVRGLKNVGAMVTGIGDAPVERLDSEVKGLLDGYEEVRHVGDVDELVGAIRRVQARGPWVHRFESTIESHMLPAAIARQTCGIPGLSPEVVELCRDKYKMKAHLRDRGFPVARQAEVRTGADARAFAEASGFPFVLKPRDGAGAHSTYKISDQAELEQAIAETSMDHVERFFTAEEFLLGHEGFFDTLTVGGHVAFEAVCHYYPNVLPAMRDRSVSPQIVTTNRIEDDGYAELRRFGRAVVGAMGIDTSPSHMEWFFGPEGLKFSEIGARPPGCNLWDLYTEALGQDLYTEWARAVCYGDTQGLPLARRAGGLVSLRPSQDGRITGYSGADAIQERYGRYIFRAHLPPEGTPTQPVEAGYLANAYIYVTHPDYDAVREMLDDIGRTLRVWAG